MTERNAFEDLIAHETADKLDIDKQDARAFAAYLTQRLIESGSIAAVAEETETGTP